MNLSIALSQIIEKSPYLDDALRQNIINITSLARQLQPQIEIMLDRKINIPAIVMAIKRLPPSPSMSLDKSLRSYMSQLGDIIVRSDLVDYSFENTGTLLSRQVELMQRLDSRSKSFYSFCKGVHETTFIISEALTPVIEEIFAEETMIVNRPRLGAISIMLPKSNIDVHGVYYILLKQLAWQGINLVEVISTSHEITLIVSKEDVDQVFSIFLKMKNT